MLQAGVVVGVEHVLVVEPLRACARGRRERAATSAIRTGTGAGLRGGTTVRPRGQEGRGRRGQAVEGDAVFVETVGADEPDGWVPLGDLDHSLDALARRASRRAWTTLTYASCRARRATAQRFQFAMWFARCSSCATTRIRGSRSCVAACDGERVVRARVVRDDVLEVSCTSVGGRSRCTRRDTGRRCTRA